MDLDGFSDFILHNVSYPEVDTFFRDAIQDHEEELRVQDRRQKDISEIARAEDEQEILRLLLQKIDSGKELTAQTAELRNIDTDNLPERKNRLKSLYLSAKLSANVSEDLYGLLLSMLTFVELSKEDKHIFEFSKHTPDSQTVRNQRIHLFKSYFQKTKESYNLALTNSEQNMAILTYKASRAQDKVKEKTDLAALIKMLNDLRLEDKEEMLRTEKLIENIKSEIQSTAEQYQLLQDGFDQLNANQICALENLEREQLKK